MTSYKIDETGRQFGRLTARSFDGAAGKWVCDCSCGNTHSVKGIYLRAGRIQSCGCGSSRLHKIHGEGGSSKTKEYRTWHGMRRRCHNPKDIAYPSYGGRGIAVCDRWRQDYLAFLADMGRAPSAAHSIDRINNDGDYEPTNCRWATAREQARNQRQTLYVEGRFMADLCRERGLKYESVRRRLARGIPWPEAAKDQRAAKVLSPEQVASIRLDSRAPQAVAADYRVNRNTIRSIRLGHTWRLA